jgi:hypothetical protein
LFILLTYLYKVRNNCSFKSSETVSEKSRITIRLGDVADLKLVCPESAAADPIEILKIKITTKIQIEKLLPKPKPNSESAAAD